MDKIENNSPEMEEDQLAYWLKYPCTNLSCYKEPVLDRSAVGIIKLICEFFKQNVEVFITTVDILEDYVRAKSDFDYEHCGSSITVACAVMISSKLVGGMTEIKIDTVQEVIQHMIKVQVSGDIIRNTEMDIITTIEKLPSTTIITNLLMFIEMYIKKLRLSIHIEPLCIEILYIVIITRMELFNKIKAVYTKSIESLQVFQQLVCNKFYFIAGIVLLALKLTNLKNILNIKQIVKDIEKISKIHSEHLEFLCNTIQGIINIDFDE